MKTFFPTLIACLITSSSFTRGEEPEFVSLFNGKDMKGWILPAPVQLWHVHPKSGELQRKGGGGFLWTEKEFANFVLTLEFKLSPGCNSGVFLRSDPGNPVQGGFEVQLLDSFGKDEVGKHDAGAFYDASAPKVNAMKKAGEWNTLRIEWIGSKLTITMNGQVVQDLDVDDWDTAGMNPDGTENKFKTALKDLPRKGKIGFQDHGHNVSFRKVMIKEVE